MKKLKRKRFRLIRDVPFKGHLRMVSGNDVVLKGCMNGGLSEVKIGGICGEDLNLFTYDEPFNDNVAKADANGWYDITIDNSSGTGNVYKTCYTLPNTNLKPSTKYYVSVEISEKTGTGIDLYAADQTTSSTDQSQFTGSLINTSGYLTTRSDFSNSKSMLRNYVKISAGGSGRIKFRIKVYEKQEYVDCYKVDLKVVAQHHKNLFNYDEPYNDSVCKADKDGWFDAYFDNTGNSSRKYVACQTKPNPNLKPNTKYYLYCELKNQANAIHELSVYWGNGSDRIPQFTGSSYDSGWITTWADVSKLSSCTCMLYTNVIVNANAYGGKRFRMAVYEEKQDSFEPHIPNQDISIVIPKAMSVSDVLTINFNDRTAYLNDTDISDLQTWKDDMFPVDDDYSITPDIDDSADMTVTYYCKNKGGFKIGKFGKQVENISVDGMSKVVLTGNSVQNGTPASDSVVEVKSVGDEDINEFRNLFNYQTTSYIKGYITRGWDGVPKNTILSSTSCYTFYMPCKPNTTYTLWRKRADISSNYPSKAFSLGCCDVIPVLNQENLMSVVNTTEGSQKLKLNITTNSTAKYICFTIEYWSYVTDKQDFIHLFEGSYDTDEVPKDYKIPLRLQSDNLYDGASQIHHTTLNYVMQLFPVFVKPNTNYTFTFKYKSLNVVNTKFAIAIKNESGSANIVNSPNTENDALSGTVNLNFNSYANSRVYLSIYQDSKSDSLYYDFGVIPKDIEYESYGGIQNIYLDEPLRKLGDYADELTVDFRHRKAIVKRYAKNITLTSNMNWKLSGNSVEGYTRAYTQYTRQSNVSGNILSNRFKGESISAWDTKSKAEYIARNDLGKVDNGDIVVSIKSDTASDLDSFKTWLDENEVYAICLIGEPITTDVSDLINWSVFPTENGTYTITADTEIQPSDSQIEYYTEEV